MAEAANRQINGNAKQMEMLHLRVAWVPHVLISMICYTYEGNFSSCFGLLLDEKRASLTNGAIRFASP